ncbi:hypothetical protein [Streptomyces sp. NPDC058157]|uniref:hypothetical protein n=1 Tax=Streptomyces sp. NPDC058157 TaxID=3346360 RepID=UPI0036EB09A0
MFLLGGVVLVLSGLAACTPAEKSLLAVERADNGATRVLIAPCPGYDADDLSVFLDEDSQGLRSWALTSELNSGSPGQVELFKPLEGWKVYDSTLTELRTPGKYVATVSGSINSRGLSGRVAFTVADLEHLGKGQVFSGNGDGRAMDREDFMHPSRELCKP